MSICQSLAWVGVTGTAYTGAPGFVVFLDRALPVCRDVPIAVYRELALLEVAYRYGQLGAAATGRALVDEVLSRVEDYPAEREALLALVAGAQARLDDPTAAHETLMDMVEERDTAILYVAQAWLAQGATDEAQALIATMAGATVVPRVAAALELGLAQGRAGDIPASRATIDAALRAAGCAWPPPDAFFAEAALAQSEIPDREGALESAAAIAEPSLRANTVAELLDRQLGPHSGAVSLIRLPPVLSGDLDAGSAALPGC